MAYITSQPPRLLISNGMVDDPNQGLAFWAYYSPIDSFNTVLQPGYISNALKINMQIGDVVYIYDQTNILVGVSSVTSFTGNAANLSQISSGGLPQAQNIWKIVNDQEDNIKILVVGDSTGNGTQRWPYLLAQWFVTQVPTYGVIYTPFQNSSLESIYGQNITTQFLYTSASTNGWTIGETVTGGTSGATGIVGGWTARGLNLTSAVGTFSSTEVVTGGTSGKTATLISAPGYQGWQAPIPLSVGTSAFNIYLDNYSISGGSPSTIEGKIGRYLKTSGRSYDLIIFNHGHNDDQTNHEQSYSALAYGVEVLKRAYPDAQILLTRQNERYDGTNAVAPSGASAPSGSNTVAQNQTNTLQSSDMVNRVAANLGLGIIDVFSAWIAYNNAYANLMDWTIGGGNIPGLHPNAAGSQYWVSIVESALAKNTISQPISRSFTSLESGAQNFLTNPLFNNWSGGSPVGYTVTGTVTQDQYNFESGQCSIKMATGALLGLDLMQYLPMLKGRWVTVAVRRWLYINEVATGAGSFQLYTRSDGNQSATVTPAGSNATLNTYSSFWQPEGWQWAVTTIWVPQDADYLGSLMVASTTNAFWIDRIVFCAGRTIGDISFNDWQYNYTAPASPILWNPNRTTTSGAPSANTVPEYQAAYIELDEQGNINLYGEVANTGNMVRAPNQTTGAGKRCSFDLTGLSAGSHTLTWTNTTSNTATVFIKSTPAGGGSTIATSSGNSVTWTHVAGYSVLIVFSPSTTQSVVCLNGVTIT